MSHVPYLFVNYISALCFIGITCKALKINGFRNPHLKNHSFRGTQGTHANAAIGYCCPFLAPKMFIFRLESF